jgi:hypothetical protein
MIYSTFSNGGCPWKTVRVPESNPAHFARFYINCLTKRSRFINKLPLDVPSKGNQSQPSLNSPSPSYFRNANPTDVFFPSSSSWSSKFQTVLKYVSIIQQIILHEILNPTEMSSQITRRTKFRCSMVSSASAWWLTYPSDKYEFVSWGYEIPNWMESHKNMFQTTNQ